MKKFADDNFKFDKNGRKTSKTVENTGGKREIAHIVFSKGLYCRDIKTRACLGKA